jgi:hypothetical protein
MPGDVLQDAVIGGGRSAAVVFGLKAVNGDRKGKIGEITPLCGYGPDGAGHYHDFYPHLLQLGQQDLQLTITYEWLSTDDRNMEGAKPSDQSQNPRH